jgi:hypothetical protein
VRSRYVVLALALAGSRAHAQPVVHASAVIALAPEHMRALEAAVTSALGEVPTTVDVSLTKLDVTQHGGELEVKVELRALVTDESGRVVWSSCARAAARGPARERMQLHRDAITGAAEALGKRVRAQHLAH